MNIQDKVFDLASKLDMDAYPSERIDDIIRHLRNNYNEDDFIVLLAISFRLCKMDDKIQQRLALSNTNYMSYEDFFQIFVTVVWERVYAYEIGIGTFIGHINKWIDYAFIDTAKTAFFTIHGYIKPEKRKDYKVCTINGLSDGIGYSQNLDKEKMNLEIREQIDDLPEAYRELIYFKFFSSDKVISDKKCAEHFNKSISKIVYIKNIAFNLLYANGICDLKDYCHSMDEDNELVFFSPDVDKEFKSGGADDEDKRTAKVNFISRYERTNVARRLAKQIA